MTNTYTWNFPAFDCYPLYESQKDVVYNIHWTLTAQDADGNLDSIYGTQGVTYEAGSPFTAFDDITLEQVTSWVEVALGEERVTELKASLDTKLNNIVNPTQVTKPTPWNVTAK